MGIECMRYNAREIKARKKATEEWLDERFSIISMTNSPSDKAYYEGAIRAIEFMGFDWRRENGKHTIFV